MCFIQYPPLLYQISIEISVQKRPVTNSAIGNKLKILSFYYTRKRIPRQLYFNYKNNLIYKSSFKSIEIKTFSPENGILNRATTEPYPHIYGERINDPNALPPLKRGNGLWKKNSRRSFLMRTADTMKSFYILHKGAKKWSLY